MSGHNKWSTIKRKKGALDSKRSKIFSRIVKEMQIAIREGGADPDGNARLRLALQNAKGANMPKENIQRVMSKSEKDSAALVEMTYEGYGPGSVAIFVECLSDNNMRTVSNIRNIFNKRGGKMENKGALSYIFDRKGVITVPKGTINPDDFELEMIDAGAEDIEIGEDVFVITTSLEDFSKVQKKLESLKIEAENAELKRIPNDTKITDVDTAMKLLRMIDEFEDDDDVQNVFHNLELTDEVMKELEKE